VKWRQNATADIVIRVTRNSEEPAKTKQQLSGKATDEGETAKLLATVTKLQECGGPTDTTTLNGPQTRLVK
jgi:hypothetical protein